MTKEPYQNSSKPPLSKEEFEAGVKARRKALSAALSALISVSDPNLVAKYRDKRESRKHPVDWLSEFRKPAEEARIANPKAHELAAQLYRLTQEAADFRETQKNKLEALRNMQTKKPKALPRANLARKLRRR